MNDTVHSELYIRREGRIKGGGVCGISRVARRVPREIHLVGCRPFQECRCEERNAEILVGAVNRKDLMSWRNQPWMS